MQAIKERQVEQAALTASVNEAEKPLDIQTWNSLPASERVTITIHSEPRYVARIAGVWTRVKLTRGESLAK